MHLPENNMGGYEMHTKVILGVTTAIGLVLGGGSAFAQEQSSGAATLEEVVITAQRREENLQKAAIAITAVSADDVARAGVTDSAQITKIAPALQVGTTAGSTSQYYMRGVGNSTLNSLSDAAVSFNIDGVPLVRTNAIQGLFYDIQRVEVLKGPQGTLYGRNATGGAVNVISNKPTLGEFSGYVNGEVGNYEAIKLEAAVNIPFGDNTALRIAGITSDHDGYYTDGNGDEELRAVRVQLTHQFNDDVRVTGGFDYTTVGGKGSGATVYGLPFDDRIGILDPRAGAIYQTKLSPAAGSFLYPVTSQPFQDNEYWGVYAQLDWTTPIGTLTVLPSHRDSDVNYSISSSSFPVNERLKSEQTTVEVRLASDSDNRLSYLVGGFYLDEDAHERPGFVQQYFAAYGDFTLPTKSYAAFSRLTYKVTDSFRVTGGIRYTKDEKKGLINAYNLLVLCPSALAGGPLCLGTPQLPNGFDIPPGFTFADGSPIPVQPWGANGAIVTNYYVSNNVAKDFTKTTYRLAFEYDLGPESLLYGSYETGFKAGGFFNSIDNPVYQPETITAYTLGSKNRFFDDRLQLNLEAFFWTYKDQQVSHFRLNSLGASEFVTENVGETKIKGLEVEARALAWEGATLNATVQYLDAEYSNFVYFNPANQGPPTTGCPFSFTGSTFRVDCSGRQAVNAPKWTINAGLEQVFNFANDGKLTFNADVRYQSSTFTGFEQLVGMEQKAFTMLDLQLAYAFPDDKLTVAVFGNNVTDEEAMGYSTPHPFGPGLVVNSLRPPRTYGVRAGYKF
jgi:iron complex outermembrane receptor protein